MSKHSPGPWEVVEDAGNHWGMREVTGPSLRIVGFTVATNVTAQKARKVDADAKLIAAAPDLAEACKLFLQKIGNGGLHVYHDPDEYDEGSPDPCKMIEAAVKKAGIEVSYE